MDTSIIPFYSLAALTFVLLCVALFVVASKILFQRRVQCPGQGREAEVLFEQTKKTPWSQGGTVDVARCSLTEGEHIGCPKGCLSCDIQAP